MAKAFLATMSAGEADHEAAFTMLLKTPFPDGKFFLRKIVGFHGFFAGDDSMGDGL